MTIVNDKTMLFFIVRHIKGIAGSMDIDTFTHWYVSKMIIPYNTPDGYRFQFDFFSALGFKKEPTIDKIYNRLKSIAIINPNN